MEKGLNNNNIFWKFAKPFLTNKGLIGRNDITLVENDVVTTGEKMLTKCLNAYKTHPSHPNK